jgi:hypothetical protein
VQLEVEQRGYWRTNRRQHRRIHAVRPAMVYPSVPNIGIEERLLCIGTTSTRRWMPSPAKSWRQWWPAS